MNSARKVRAVEKQKILDARKMQREKEATERVKAKLETEKAKDEAKEIREAERQASKEVNIIIFLYFSINVIFIHNALFCVYYIKPQSGQRRCARGGTCGKRSSGG